MKKILKVFLKKPVFIFLNKFTNLLNRKKHSNRILIVKPDAVGDFIIFSKFLKCYKNIFPQENIDILINSTNLELAKDCKEISEIMTINRNKYYNDIKYRLRIIREIIKKRYKTVIYPVYSREDIGEYITVFSGAKEKIGISGDLNNIEESTRKITDKFYTKLINVGNHKDHEILKAERFLKELGYLGDDFTTFIKIGSEDKAKVKTYLDEKVLANFIVFVPGCGTKIRDWGTANNAALIDKIISNYDHYIVICGAPNEVQLVNDILSKVSSKSQKIINITGKTNLHQLIYIVSQAKCYVGSETSTVHMAEMVNTPSVCLLGGGHYGRFYPYPDSKLDFSVSKNMECFNCGWKCSYDEAKCIKDIQVEDVLEMLQKVI